MARRQDHTPVQLQQLTMDTVLALLQQQPASSLSLRQIAREVGYSPGTLINQFGSYGLLLLAANARTLDQIYRELCAAIEQADSPQQALEACAMSYLNFASQHPHQWRLLFEHQLPEQETCPTGNNNASTMYSLCCNSSSPYSNPAPPPPTAPKPHEPSGPAYTASACWLWTINYLPRAISVVTA